MYCGGNEMIVAPEPIRSAKVTGTVLDPTGLELPGARIQLQVQGSNSILLDITADEKGRFHLPKLQPAAYWLGISRAGFNLHVWDLRITRSGGTVRLRSKRLHHLKNGIEDSRNTVLLTGYCAQNTLGRKIEEKRTVVPVFGELMRLRAGVEKLDKLSGHADQRELLEWISPIASGLRKAFLVHGEPDQQAALKEAIVDRFKLAVEVPGRGQTFEL